MIPAAGIYARVSDANGEIAKLSLRRRHFQPGDNIIGLIDFRDTPKAARICSQFSILLIGVESLPQESSSTYPEERTVQARTQETCYGTDAVSFHIEVPPKITPTFSTPFCKFVYLLDF